MSSKSAFPHTLGGLYKFDPHEDLFIPGVDGVPEFPRLVQKWRAKETIDPTDIESVIAHGVMQAIRVRKRKDGKAEVIDGRQRVRWARVANDQLRAEGVPENRLIKVPGINDMDRDESVAVRKMAALNYHRVDPNLMQRSDDSWQMIKDMGESDPTAVSKSSLQAAASEMRCSINTVRNYVALQLLIPMAQDVAATGGLPLNALVALARMTDDQQFLSVTRLLASKSEGSTNEKLVEMARGTRDVTEDGPVLDDGEVDEEGEGEGDEGEGTTVDDAVEGAVVEGEAPAKPKKTTKKKKAAEVAAPSGLRMSQAKGMLRLAQSDRKLGHGAGMSLPDDAIKMLRVLVGDAEARVLKGATELLNRLAGGE
jgi:hypothetical protein